MSDNIKGSEILMRALIDQGVDKIFGYPGGQIMPVYDSLYDYTDRIHHYLARHEQGAIHAAEGYARASGKTGVVIATSGPGAMNLITGLNDALMDSTPIVAITGQVPSTLLGKDAFQESDVVSVTLPVTKWSVLVRTAEEIAPAIAKAFYIANSGRPGPVVIDIAKDAQVGLAEYKRISCNFIRSYNPDPELDHDILDQAAALLNSAERPMILSGHGVTISDASKELIELAEKGDIPVACTIHGLSTIPSSHPLNKGLLGMHGNLGPNINTNKADVILAVGMRFDDRVTGDTRKYAPQAKIIHIDIDSSEFDKTVISDIHIHANAKTALKGLLPLVKKNSHTSWVDSFLRHEKVEYDRVKKLELFPENKDGKMHMGEVVNKVSEAFGNNAILITDVGQNQMFSVRYFRFSSPRSCITSGGLGTMGFGLPASIGAKIAKPERDVVLFVGDGGLQMTIEELGVIMEYNVGVKIILLNNNYLGNVRQWQELFFNSRYSATPMTNPDFVALAAAYGIAGENVPHRDNLDDAIRRMKDHDGAYLLNVNIEEMGMIFPMTPGGHGVDEILLNSTEYYKPV